MGKNKTKQIKCLEIKEKLSQKDNFCVKNEINADKRRISRTWEYMRMKTLGNDA